MSFNRRKFLVGAAAAPLLVAAAGHAVAATVTPSEPTLDMDDIAMLIYPGFTALDFMGPHHFFGGMPRAKIHVVTNGTDLSPVASDLGLLVQPTATLESCPTDLTLIFVPGGTAGTVAAASDLVLCPRRDRGSRARYVTSVCTGSLVLGPLAFSMESERLHTGYAAAPRSVRRDAGQ